MQLNYQSMSHLPQVITGAKDNAGDFLIKTPFEDYKYLEPARSVPYRHDSILLVLDSTEEGLNKWIH